MDDASNRRSERKRTMSKTDDELAKLRAEVAELKRTVRSSNHGSEEEIAKYRDELHQAREQQMSRASNFSAEDLKAMNDACPPSAMRDIITRGAAPRPPSADGVSGQLTRAHPSPGLPGSNRGWVDARPIGPPPGIQHVDRLVDAQDARDRHDLLVAEARRAAERKIAEGK
jgi:hypothetical protein